MVISTVNGWEKYVERLYTWPAAYDEDLDIDLDAPLEDICAPKPKRQKQKDTDPASLSSYGL